MPTVRSHCSIETTDHGWDSFAFLDGYDIGTIEQAIEDGSLFALAPEGPPVEIPDEFFGGERPEFRGFECAEDMLS